MTDLWELDWAQIGQHGTVLHAPIFTTTQAHTRDHDNDGITGTGATRCGRTDIQLHIPGIFSRLNAKRCTRCCKTLGYPPGTGSPKNDHTIRALLNLDKESA